MMLLVGVLAFIDGMYSTIRACYKLHSLRNTVTNSHYAIGALQFNNVEDLPGDNWIGNIQIPSPIINAVLNFLTENLAPAILFSGLEIPFVCDFEEGLLF